jgi:hypothetical protein
MKINQAADARNSYGVAAPTSALPTVQRIHAADATIVKMQLRKQRVGVIHEFMNYPYSLNYQLSIINYQLA